MKTANSQAAELHLQGIRLDNLSMSEALSCIEQALAAGQPTRIAFANADCLNLAAGNAAYRQHLAGMDRVFIDGVGMRIAARLLGQSVRANVNGTDLFPLLCASLARQGKRLYLLGGRPGVAAQAATWARRNFPGLRVAGISHGYYPASEEAMLANEIHDSRADVLLVGLGAPHQEAWITRHMAACGATVAMGVGGLFDFYGGRVPRAPFWMRRLGLEWVFRLYQEPARLWRRYLLGNPSFLCRACREALGKLFSRHTEGKHHESI